MPADLTTTSQQVFWTRCFDPLTPGGCLASNWADFTVDPNVRPMTEMLAAVARGRGLEPIFVTRRGFRNNLAQYVSTAPGRAPEALDSALERFAGERHLPDQGRGIPENCLVTKNFPVD